MPITKPTDEVATSPANYLDEDSETAEPKIGTTVQQGWEAAEALLTETSGDFPTEFRFSEQPQLIKFLEDGPFRVYEQHWIERPTGKKSFVALAENDPFTDILGSKPRSRFAFNVLVLTGEAQGVQILTAPPTLARLIKKSHEDERKGPLSKEFWEISRMGTGPTTNYTMEFVRETPRSEMLKIARSLV